MFYVVFFYYAVFCPHIRKSCGYWKLVINILALFKLSSMSLESNWIGFCSNFSFWWANLIQNVYLRRHITSNGRSWTFRQVQPLLGGRNLTLEVLRKWVNKTFSVIISSLHRNLPEINDFPYQMFRFSPFLH